MIVDTLFGSLAALLMVIQVLYSTSRPLFENPFCRRQDLISLPDVPLFLAQA
jgi:hypothetical protein